MNLYVRPKNVTPTDVVNRTKKELDDEFRKHTYLDCRFDSDNKDVVIIVTYSGEILANSDIVDVVMEKDGAFRHLPYHN